MKHKMVQSQVHLWTAAVLQTPPDLSGPVGLDWLLAWGLKQHVEAAFSLMRHISGSNWSELWSSC